MTPYMPQPRSAAPGTCSQTSAGLQLTSTSQAGQGSRWRWHSEPVKEKIAWCITTQEHPPESCLEWDYSLGGDTHAFRSQGYYDDAVTSLYVRRRRDLNDGQKDKLDQTSTNSVQTNPDSWIFCSEVHEISQIDSFPLNKERKMGEDEV